MAGLGARRAHRDRDRAPAAGRSPARTPRRPASPAPAGARTRRGGRMTEPFPFPRECPYDPPPRLAQLQRDAPISRVRIWDGSTPWLLTRYDDVRAVLADRRFSVDPTRPGYPARGPAGRA